MAVIFTITEFTISGSIHMGINAVSRMHTFESRKRNYNVKLSLPEIGTMINDSVKHFTARLSLINHLVKYVRIFVV